MRFPPDPVPRHFFLARSRSLYCTTEASVGLAEMSIIRVPIFSLFYTPPHTAPLESRPAGAPRTYPIGVALFSAELHFLPGQGIKGVGGGVSRFSPQGEKARVSAARPRFEMSRKEKETFPGKAGSLGSAFQPGCIPPRWKRGAPSASNPHARHSERGKGAGGEPWQGSTWNRDKVTSLLQLRTARGRGRKSRLLSVPNKRRKPRLAVLGPLPQSGAALYWRAAAFRCRSPPVGTPGRQLLSIASLASPQCKPPTAAAKERGRWARGEGRKYTVQSFAVLLSTFFFF